MILSREAGEGRKRARCVRRDPVFNPFLRCGARPLHRLAVPSPVTLRFTGED